MLTSKDNKFREQLGGFFYDMLKSAGITMTPGNFPERVREVGAKMADTIELVAERKAIQVIQQLQAAVVKGFEGMEKEMAELRELVAKQQAALEALAKRKGSE